jgi:hypothetical protein
MHFIRKVDEKIVLSYFLIWEYYNIVYIFIYSLRRTKLYVRYSIHYYFNPFNIFLLKNNSINYFNIISYNIIISEIILLINLNKINYIKRKIYKLFENLCIKDILIFV